MGTGQSAGASGSVGGCGCAWGKDTATQGPDPSFPLSLLQIQETPELVAKICTVFKCFSLGVSIL